MEEKIIGSDEMKMMIAARKDLSPGKLAAQVAHAAVACSFKAKKENAKWFNRWMKGGGKKVVVGIDDEEELLALEKKAKEIGLTTALIKDAGHTEVPPGTMTALAMGPAPEKEVDKVTGKLSLL